jgi:serine/threonine protein kinase
MKDLTHPFILKLVHSIETPMCIYLILEFCEKGDLETFMENNQISELKAKFMLAEIVLALEYLHSKNVIYRDLKPANILLDSYGHVRLADFGLAKEINEQELSVSTIVGSPAYISPEILARENITKATDKYALGIVMHQLLTNELPFAHLDMDRIFSLIRKGQLKFSGELGRDARDLVVSLTNRKAQKRPSYEEIKKHVFFKGIDWQVMMQKRYLPPDH